MNMGKTINDIVSNIVSNTCINIFDISRENKTIQEETSTKTFWNVHLFVK